MKTLTQRLKVFDKEYFEYIKKDDVLTEDQISRNLATWLYDGDADFDSETWDRVMKVRKEWPEIWWLTLENLFKGKHDT